MRTLLFVCLGLLFTSSLSAQYYNKSDRFIVGLNGGVVKPLGDFADVSKSGIDFSLNAKLLLNPKLAVGLSLGYMDFGQNDDLWTGGNQGENTVNYQIIPIVFTATYFIQAYDLDFRPYASLGFGYFIYRNHVDFTSANPAEYPYNNFASLEYTINDNVIGLIPNVGFLYNLSKEWAVDVNAKFTYIPNFDEVRSVRQTYTHVADAYDGDKTRLIENYATGFSKISTASLTVGLYYRF
jgi:outer membrane protein W